jgi:hypothetical protein
MGQIGPRVKRFLGPGGPGAGPGQESGSPLAAARASCYKGAAIRGPEDTVAPKEAAMRQASIERNTNETRISASVDLDGTGRYEIATGIGFLDHMLEQLSRHSLIDITLKAEGDLHIDFHHTTEDSGIALGQAVAQALGERKGIRRYGSALSPMDETLTRISLDASNRAYLVWKVDLKRDKLADPARREPLRRELPPHRRVLLQGPGARAAPGDRDRPAQGRRRALHQGQPLGTLGPRAPPGRVGCL